MINYIDIAHRTCRVDIYKTRFLDFSHRNGGRKNEWHYTVKKGDKVYFGSISDLATIFKTTKNAMKTAWYERQSYKGFIMTRVKINK